MLIVSLIISGSAFAKEPKIIYPIIKGTNTPDYGSPDRQVIKNGIVYPVIKGTNTPDYGKPQLVIK